MTLRPYKPYVSIDIETTGLAPESDILEIGAIFDDGSNELQFFNVIIKYDKYKHSEPYAMAMNSEIVRESIQVNSLKSSPPKEAFMQFNDWLEKMRGTLVNQGKIPRLYVAGKNVAGFDIPLLRSNTKYYAGFDITENFTHRTIDVGSMFFDEFGENVTLGDINKLTGRASEVSHRALDDAGDVVEAIRYKMRVK